MTSIHTWFHDTRPQFRRTPERTNRRTVRRTVRPSKHHISVQYNAAVAAGDRRCLPCLCSFSNASTQITTAVVS